MNCIIVQKICPLLVLLFAIASCSSTLSPPPQWLPFNTGLETHATVLSLAIDPRDPNRIFAGAYDTPGLYRSLDQARSWQPFADGLGHAAVLTLQFIGDSLYAGTTNGLYQLANDRWVPVVNVPSVAIYDITHGSGGAFFLATDRRGIFKSSDSGESWVRIPGLNDKIVLSVASMNEQTIFAGTSGQGAFITHDHGTSWQALDLFKADYVSFIQVDPRDQRTIFLRTRRGLFRSRDLGTSWEMLRGGIENSIANALLITPSRLYAATSAGVLVSEDNGATWRAASAGLPRSAQPLTIAQLNAQTILVGTQTGVFLSRDSGTSWRAAGLGLGEAVVHSLALTESGVLLAATEDGLYASQSDGNFHFMGSNAMHVPMLSVATAPSAPKKIYAGSYQHGIFVSDDAGATWNAAGDIFRGRLAAPGLAVNPGDAGVIFARVLFQRIYKSEDGGASWRAVWTGMSDDTEVETMVGAPSDPAIMFAGTNFGIFISRDGGESWTPRGLSDPTSLWSAYRNVFAVWIDPHDPKRILAGATDGLYESGDLGETWTLTNLNHVTITAIVCDTQGNFYAGTKYNGVWLSRDDAKTWERFGAGMDEVSVNALVIGGAREMLYAATPRGIFKVSLPAEARPGLLRQ